MKSKAPFVRNIVGVICILTILACGGGGSDTAGSHFPLTASIPFVGTNHDVDNIHFLVNAETFDPSNRVVPGATVERATTFTKTWTSAASVETLTVFAGRNGVVLANKTIDYSGDARNRPLKVRATWDGANLTVSKS